MNERERFLKIMAFEPVDGVPNYELGCWGQTIQRWFDEGLPEDAVYIANDILLLEGEPYLGIDRKAFAHIYTGMMPGFPYETIEETDRYLVARHTNGILTKALKEGTERGTRLSMDQYLDFPVKDRASFTDIKKRYDPHSPIRYPLWWDEWVRIWQTRDYPLCLLGNGTFGLYSQLRWWVGTEGISYLFHDDPAFVEEMIEFATEFMLQLVDRALEEVEFDHFSFFEDMAGKNGPLVSPPVFEKLFVPYYKRIVERLRQAGIHSIWLDCDGNPEAIIPLMLEAGINCLWPLEQAADMDPLRLRKEYGRDLVLVGGIDKQEIAKGRAAIERELNAKIPPLLESGGYIPMLDHTFHPDISYENLRHYLEVKAKLIGKA